MKFALIAFGNEESYGLLFVGGELLANGQDVRFFDAEEKDTVTRVVDWRPDFACFSPMTTFYPAALKVAGSLKRELPDVVTAFGGHHAMALPGIADRPEIDAVVVGPVRGSIERILAGERGVLKTRPTDPGDLPRPARREYYADVPRMGARYRKMLLSMLGCPWNCSYCSSSSGHMRSLFGTEAHRRYYLGRRPLAAIIEEAKEIAAYDTHEIEWVDDDVFAGSDVEEWIPRFAAEWRKEIGLPMYVSTTSQYALKVSDGVLEALKPLVNVVGMGVQAIRPGSLELFNRSWDNEEKMKAAYDRLCSFGYRVNLQAIVGLPVTDPVEDAIETVLGLQRIGPGSVCSLYPLMVYPGTGIEATCLERGIELNRECTGDTNTGIPHILFPPDVTRRLRNLCKFGTLFVKHNVDEQWMRALIDVEFDEETSRRLSMVRYHDCVVDRLGNKGEQIFRDILSGMKLRY